MASASKPRDPLKRHTRLTEAQRTRIRQLWAQGVRQTTIAKRLGIAQSTVSLLCRPKPAS